MPQYWVEISALAHGHGGPGWELGVCLWSPAADRGDSKRYEIMRELSPHGPSAATSLFSCEAKGDDRILTRPLGRPHVP